MQRASSSLSVIPVTVRSSVEIVTRHAATVEGEHRMVGEAGDDARLHVRGGAQVERDVARGQRGEQLGVVGRRHAVRDATDPEVDDLAHPAGARHLAGVGGERRARARAP